MYRWIAPILATSLMLTGCASTRIKNEHLARWVPDAGYPTPTQMPGQRSGDLLLFVAFSGGGTRAAALSYGVLERLRDTRIRIDGRERRLLDEVDIVSGVSGGAFPAAYFALYGDWIFRDFEPRFLKNDVQGELVARLFDPGNWVRQFSPFYSRWQIASEYYDQELFHGATFGDLARRPGPYMLINATDLSTGGRFAFNQGYFDMICSDLSKFPLSVAVTASSAIPVLFTPITLENYAGTCGYQPSPSLEHSLNDPGSPLRRRAYARQRQAYLEPNRHRYVHLVDGGISDNLGLREPFDLVVKEGPDLGAVLREAGHAGVRDIVFLVVNSQIETAYSGAIADLSPALSDVLNAVTSVQIDRYNFETLELVQTTFDRWTRELSRPDHPVNFHLIQVSFDDVENEEQRRYFHNLPTSFFLEPTDVDRLSAAGSDLLGRNPAFQHLVAHLNGVCGPDGRPAADCGDTPAPVAKQPPAVEQCRRKPGGCATQPSSVNRPTNGRAAAITRQGRHP